MNKIDLNNAFPALDKQKRRLKELKCEERELNLKQRMKMPMSSDEHDRFERIGADIDQIEYMIEWMENSDKDDFEDEWGD